MKPEQILLDTLNQLKTQLDYIQKDVADSKSKLEVHLETSILRVEGYDKFNEYVEATMQGLRKDVDFCLDYIKDQESKKKGIEENKKAISDWAKGIKWVLGIIITLFAIKPIFVGLIKFFGVK